MVSLSPAAAPGERIIAKSLHESHTTNGYCLNHTMLRIKDPDTSLRFYIDFMGMSLVFTMNAGPFTAYYLAYPFPKDTSPEDIAKSTSSRAGLLELVYVHETTSGTNSTSYCNEQGIVGFGHLGFCVPDVQETLQRATKAGWKVVKHSSDVSVKSMALPDAIPDDAFHPNFVAIYNQIGFISDPDG